MAVEVRYQRPDDDGKRNDDEEDAEQEDEAQRTDGKRSDAVPGESQHAAERIFRLAGKAGGAVVFNRCLAVSQRFHHAAQEKVALRITQQRFCRAATHKAKVGVVVHHLRSQPVHKTIEEHRRLPLKACVG